MVDGLENSVGGLSIHRQYGTDDIKNTILYG